MKLYLFRAMKLTILFLLSTLLLKVIPFVPLNSDDSLHIALAYVMMYSLFEILAPSYTIIVTDKEKKIYKIT
jgi:hypothetical protein